MYLLSLNCEDISEWDTSINTNYPTCKPGAYSGFCQVIVSVFIFM